MLNLSLIAHDIVRVPLFMKTLLSFMIHALKVAQIVQTTDVKRNAVHFHAGTFANQVHVCQRKL